MDRDWDLAALSIRRPNVRPIPLATVAPRRGEALTIAGYGSGWYRAATGRCIQYVAPQENFPYEMLELSTPARNGDSGGPIFNNRGELAGVLFGASFGQTTGTYCGRVRWFLHSVLGDFQESPRDGVMIAARPRQNPLRADERVQARPQPVAAIESQGPLPRPSATSQPPIASRDLTTRPPTPSDPPGPAAASADEPRAAAPTPGPTRAEQVKTVLAAVGAISILLCGMRLCGAILSA
jgi:hypothetical protein